MGVVEHYTKATSGALALVAGACTLLMMVHVIADVAAKYFLNLPIEGTLEIVSQYYMVALVFLPMAIVEIRHQHIRVDAFLTLMPAALSRYLYVATALLAAVFYGILAWQTCLTAIHSTRINEMMMGTSYVVIWPSKWFLPVGFAALTVATMLHAIQAAAGWLATRPAPLPEE